MYVPSLVSVANLKNFLWVCCFRFQVSAERQAALTRLCTGRAGVGRRLVHSTSMDENTSNSVRMPDAEVEGIRYKVVWSCLLLVEMVMTNIEAAAHFQSLTSNVVAKVAELLRLFNSRATQLVLGAGAIHSAARLKSINAKHLSLVTQCLGMTIAILPHIRAALMAQLPPKQHTLLSDLDKIKKEFADHNEKVLNKFVTIIGGIVEHGLAKHIVGTNFDARAMEGATKDSGVACCVFLEGVLTNTKKMHQVLSALLPPEHLQDVFSRIFAFIDQKIPALFISASESKGTAPGTAPPPQGRFSFPSSDGGKRRMLDEVDSVTKSLNGLEGVFPWDFSAVSVLAKTLEFELPDKQPIPEVQEEKASDAAVSETDDAEVVNGDHASGQSENSPVEGDDAGGSDAAGDAAAKELPGADIANAAGEDEATNTEEEAAAEPEDKDAPVANNDDNVAEDSPYKGPIANSPANGQNIEAEKPTEPA
jgi:vacuolar protein sorting-associated protein 54